jgi:nucleotidyltransferase substrate binding protein (TIGR01987 family)
MQAQDKKLDTNKLNDAVLALKKCIDAYNEFSQTNSGKLKEPLRTAVIKNFEIAYEVCWKFMKRWMEINIGSDIFENKTRKEFYRLAAENGLISDLNEWWEFHESRNKTAHLYSESTAEEVFETAINFLPIAQKFIKEYEEAEC